MKTELDWRCCNSHSTPLKMLLAVYFAALLCAVLGRAQEIDPLSNLRPNNVTGLIYYLYRWTGSYASPLAPSAR